VRIVMQKTADVQMQDLAEALIDAGPKEFAQFWLHFSKQTEKNEEFIREAARHMAPTRGGLRKQGLSRVYKWMQHYECVSELQEAGDE
jgi:predicted patatin/cPLA2 family phospholipase